MAAAGAILARLAPMLTRVGGSAVGQAAKAGAIQGVTGRVANMVQGQKDGQSGSQNENLQGYFPGRGGY